MKNWIIGLAAAGFLSVSLGASAAMPTRAAPFEVNVPDLEEGFLITVEGMFLKPTNSDLDYTIVTRAGMGNTTNLDVVSIDPDYDWGFRAEIGYVFPDSGNDVRLGYTYLKADDNDRTDFDFIDGAPIVDPINNIGFFKFHGVEAHSEFKYDMVDLNVGQYIDVGTRLSLRLSGGLRWAQLRRDFNKRFLFGRPDDDTGWSLESNAYSKFEGIGPEFGVDADYHVGGCFGVVGRAYTGILVGDMDTHSEFVFDLAQRQEGDDGPHRIKFNSNSKEYTVPYLDTKLGIDYTAHFACGSNFTAELGWQFTHYWDSTVRLIPTFGGTGDVNAGIVGLRRNISDIGFNGPYLSLHLKV